MNGEGMPKAGDSVGALSYASVRAPVRLWKIYLMAVVACAPAGFVGGVVGTSVENYYSTSGPSFPGWWPEWLGCLGYPGFLLAGRTGPPGWIDWIHAYNWVAVSTWNAVTWPVLLPPLICAGFYVVRCFRGRWRR